MSKKKSLKTVSLRKEVKIASLKRDRSLQRLKRVKRVKRALVLVSGGIDSAVALWLVKKRNWHTTVLSFGIHHQPLGEKRAFQKLCRAAGVKHKIILPLSFLKEKNAFSKAPEGYIPARNLIFYSAAASLAESMGADWIVGGHNRSDGESFADAQTGYFKELGRLIHKGSQVKAPKLWFPLISLTHEQVIRLGHNLGVPLQYTWTCYRDGVKPCGRCQSCRDRKKAFIKASLRDPVEYPGSFRKGS